MEKPACGKDCGFDWSREATLLLIQLYERYPCLYIPTLQDYHNRNVRDKALQEIVNNFNKQKLTNLTIQEIKKKLHGIRAQFLAELKKIKKSEASGASTDKIYIPKLWCFDHLQFLRQGSVVVSAGESNMTNLLHVETDNTQEERNEVEILFDGDVNQIGDSDIELLSPTSETSSRAEDIGRGTSRKRKRQQTEKSQISGLLSTAVASLEKVAATPEESAVTWPKQRQTHALFGQFIADEMEMLQDPTIIDDLKQSIVNAVFEAKKQQREKNLLSN